MNPAKLIAFLLGLAGLALLLVFGFVSFAGPPLVPPPSPLDQFSPGCLGLILFASSIPIAAVPGLAGLGLWWFVVRKKEAADDAETMATPEREASFQARLDGLTLRLVEHGGDATALVAEIPIWTRDLDASQRNRLLRLLAACGGDGSGAINTPPLSDLQAETPGWGTRALSLGLLAFAAFCALWGAFVAFSLLTSDIGKVLGLGSGPEMAAYGSGSCFVVALAALLGGLALRWLTRRETRRIRQLATTRQRTAGVVLASCLRRMESLLQGSDAGAPPPETSGAARIARAHVVCALPELDGAGKGRLIAWLHSASLLPRLALSGADLRGAVLAGTDLSTAALAGVNLSGADLSRARLVQADLRASQLQRADLRGADAAGADLRQADLRQARMHRCNLRQADLRGADLREANLWQVDLAGAQVDGALSGTAGSRAGQLPSLPESSRESRP
jgi:hypothetical protein